MTAMYHVDTLPEPNKHDAEDCARCDALDGVCLYHEGQVHGENTVLDGIRLAATLFHVDPDALSGLLHQYQRHCQQARTCPAVLHRQGCPATT